MRAIRQTGLMGLAKTLVGSPQRGREVKDTTQIMTCYLAVNTPVIKTKKKINLTNTKNYPKDTKLFS